MIRISDHAATPSTITRDLRPKAFALTHTSLIHLRLQHRVDALLAHLLLLLRRYLVHGMIGREIIHCVRLTGRVEDNAPALAYGYLASGFLSVGGCKSACEFDLLALVYRRGSSVLLVDTLGCFLVSSRKCSSCSLWRNAWDQYVGGGPSVSVLPRFSAAQAVASCSTLLGWDIPSARLLRCNWFR